MLRLRGNVGDQRKIHVQLVVDNRRIKRGSKRKIKSKYPELTRVVHVLTTGKILDYTHPKEIDPYWGILYKQYEYLCYKEMQYRYSICNIDRILQDDEIKSMVIDLEYIRSHKEKLLTMMMNFMNMMYGSVIQSRFYGWKKYMDEFVSKFNEISVTNLNYLRFDIGKTRCSVYFYQAFWLAGLSFINKITDTHKKYKTEIDRPDRGNIYLSEIDKPFDELTEECTAEELYSLKDRFAAKQITSEEIQKEANNTPSQCYEGPSIHAVDKDEYIEEATDGNTPQHEIERCEELDQAQETHHILERLLNRLNIPLQYIYNASPQSLAIIACSIKKKIKAGEIRLNNYEKEIIKSIYLKETVFEK